MRALRFVVDPNGRIMGDGAFRGERVLVDATANRSDRQGEGAGPVAPDDRAWYGNPNLQPEATVDRVYAQQNVQTGESENVPTMDAAADALVDDAEKLYRWYYDDMTRGTTQDGDPVDPEQCQMAIERVDALLPELRELGATPG